MEKICILVENKEGLSSKLLAEQIKALNKENDLAVKDLDDICIEIFSDKKNSDIRCFSIDDNTSLSQFSTIYIRNWIIRHKEEVAATIALFGKQKKIKVLDDYLSTVKHGGKLLQCALLAKHNIAIPNTIYKHTSRMQNEDYDYIAGKLGTPFILKDTFGHKGSNNYLIKTKSDFISKLSLIKKTPKVRYICQNFIPNSFDYRYLIIDNKVKSVIKRTRLSDSDHRNNTSVGAKLEYLKARDWKYKKLAMKTAKLFKRNVAGVDIIVDSKTMRPYIIEVNPAPGLVNLEKPEETTKVEALLETLL